MQDTTVLTLANAEKGVLREINQALVALDLTETDKSIIQYLSYFAKYLPIKATHYLHVVPYFESHDPFFMKNIETLHNIWDRNEGIIAEMGKEVEEAFESHESVVSQYEVATGNPLAELLVTAENSEAELVVIGQKKEESGFGILAKNLVRKVPGNALIIPKGTPPKITTILVPIDFSGYSANALETASIIGAKLETPAKLVCVNVFGLPNMSIYTSGADRAKFTKAMESQAEEAMDIFLEKFAANYPGEIETFILDQEGGPVAPYLFDCAKMEKADLIIMGAKGHSQVERLLIGSVTERMMTINKEIPTLVIR
jgi:nucleotide-binding universal stress UspA family protein